MGVIATCSTCHDEHILADRLADHDHCTTVCPVCGATAYGSEPQGERNVKSERERIHDAVATVHGMGEKNLANLQNTYGLYAELVAADVDELVSIDGIGQKTAERIADRVS